MIEGVNSSIASSVLVRPAVDQVERVASYSANPNQVQRVAAPPYLSLNVAMNYTIDKAVLQFRDAESGEVLSQIPSEKQIKAYRRAASQQPVIFEPKVDAAEAREANASDTIPTPSVETEGDVDIEVTTGGDDAPEAVSSAPVEITA